MKKVIEMTKHILSGVVAALYALEIGVSIAAYVAQH